MVTDKKIKLLRFNKELILYHNSRELQLVKKQVGYEVYLSQGPLDNGGYNSILLGIVYSDNDLESIVRVFIY